MTRKPIAFTAFALSLILLVGCGNTGGVPVDASLEVTDTAENEEVVEGTNVAFSVTKSPTEEESGENTAATEETRDVEGLTALAQVPNYVNVRTEPNTESDIVGKIYNDCAAEIIEEVEGEDGDWYRIISGNVDGYIKSEFFVVGEEAEAMKEQVGVLMGTVNEDYLRVRSEPDLTNDDNVFTYYEKGTEVYIKELTEDGWAEIESDDASAGYVYAECLTIERVFKTAITIEEEEEQLAKKAAAEEAARIAQEEYEAALKAEEESKAAEESASASAAESSSIAESQWLSQSAESAAASKQAESVWLSQQAAAAQTAAATQAAAATTQAIISQTTGSALRNAVVAYALQFVGNPYVHGGRSLITGTDCSGFTMLVYQNFGYSLDSTPAGQSCQGVQIPYTEAQPGDLLFYSNSQKYLGHVALYIGNGQIVHAGTEATGIEVRSAYYREPLFAVRIIND